MPAKDSRIIRPLYRRLLIISLLLFSLAIFVYIFPLIQDLVVVTIISLVLTYIFRPIMIYLERKGLPRIYTILSIFAVVIALLILSINYLVPVIVEEAGSLISNLERVELSHMMTNLLAWLDKKVPGIVGILGLESGNVGGLLDQARLYISGALQQSVTILAGAANLFALMIVVPFLTFFMLKDGDRLMRTWVEKVPNRFFEMSLSLGHRVDRQLGNYIRSILIESLIVGVLTGVAFSLLGFKFAVIIGLVSGLLNAIPFFGPLIAYIPIGIVVLLTYTPIGWGLLWMVVILLAVQMVDNVLLKPLLISRSVEVHPAAVLLVVLIGGRLAGAIGMFVAVPVYAIIQVIVVDMYDHLRRYRIL